MCQRFWGAKGLIEMWRNLEENRPWVNVWLMFQHFSLKLLWVLDTLALFASDMWSCEMFFDRQWNDHSIQNMPPLFLPKKAPCFGSFRTRVHFPEVYHSLPFPKEKPIQTTLAKLKALSNSPTVFWGPSFSTILGLSTGPIWPVKRPRKRPWMPTRQRWRLYQPRHQRHPMIHVWCLVARHGTKTAWISKVENGGVWRLELCQLYCTKLTNQVCDSVLVLMKNVYHTHTHTHHSMVNIWKHIRK